MRRPATLSTTTGHPPAELRSRLASHSKRDSKFVKTLGLVARVFRYEAFLDSLQNVDGPCPHVEELVTTTSSHEDPSLTASAMPAEATRK